MQHDWVVVITGAAGGIWSVLVDRFLANEDTVTATDATAPADISSEHDCLELASLADQTAGRNDVLVNCAGYFPVIPFVKMSAADWGRIINFSSGSVFSGVPGQTHYVPAKAGLIGCSRSLAREGWCLRHHRQRRNARPDRHQSSARHVLLPGLTERSLHLGTDPQRRRRPDHAPKETGR